jgi:hypothetical protein
VPWRPWWLATGYVIIREPLDANVPVPDGFVETLLYMAKTNGTGLGNTSKLPAWKRIFSDKLCESGDSKRYMLTRLGERFPAKPMYCQYIQHLIAFALRQLSPVHEIPSLTLIASAPGCKAQKKHCDWSPAELSLLGPTDPSQYDRAFLCCHYCFSSVSVSVVCSPRVCIFFVPAKDHD